MSDLISRQAVIDALKNMYDAAEKWRCEAKDEVIKARAESCMASLIEMKLRSEKLPSAQPDRKMGKWIYEGKRGRFPACRCSVCGNVENADWAMISGEVNYCPNCGSSMQ